MLHRISITNYQSIREEVTLDFRVPRTTPDKPCFRCTIPQAEFRLPTAVVLVGPNGAGKSAILRALANTIDFVVRSFKNDAESIYGFPPFLSKETFGSPTRVEIDFDATWFGTSKNSPSRRFRYILELARDTRSYYPDRVECEILLDFPKGRPRRLVARRSNQAVYVARDMAIKSSDDRLSHIPDNASIFSTLDRMGVETFSDIVADFCTFQMNIATIGRRKQDEDRITEYYRENPEMKDEVSNQLGRFDLGIVGMHVMKSDYRNWRLRFQHDGLYLPVDFADESTGTRRVVNEFPALNLALTNGSLAVMDAFDNDLHTDLVVELLNWFRHQDTNSHNAQLICALHNVSAFDILEKEEIFVVEKNEQGVTRAFGLSEVEGLRRGSNLHKQYRSGILGGIPTFG